MTDTVAYTPYDGTSRPFTIGLSQLEPERWLEPDGDLAEQVALKRDLVAVHGERVLRAEPGTEAAQQEVLDLLAAYLPVHHPARYRHVGTRLVAPGLEVDLADRTLIPLHRAGLLVQDDLVLMRKGEEGWRIAAAFLAFPSSWKLEDKFGRVMEDVHAPVPGFEGGSRNAGLINRMFDNLPPGHVLVRWNWSVNWRRALYHPVSPPAGEIEAVPPAGAVIRIERQTLRRLPLSGDMLFTIRIYLDPLRTIMAQPNGGELAVSLARQLEDLTEEQAAYKGLLPRRQDLIALLRAVPQALASSDSRG